MAKNEQLMKTLAHTRTVKYQRVKCPVCLLNLLQRWNNVLREDHCPIPEEELASAITSKEVQERAERPLTEFNRYTSIFYCEDCRSVLHHSVIKKVDKPEDTEEITLIWAVNQVPTSA